MTMAVAVVPAVTVLQLDTNFPRIMGDVGCPQTYVNTSEILPIPLATVAQIVHSDPASIDMTPFEEALLQAKGDVIVTSCGFLSYWQNHLAQLIDRPFISSSLIQLPALIERYRPKDILTITFDADKLNQNHYGAHETDIIGLPHDIHLRRVISQDLTILDAERAAREITDFIASHTKPHHKHILLECTNLPPYKQAIAAKTGLPITDILTSIEALRPHTIHPHFINH